MRVHIFACAVCMRVCVHVRALPVCVCVCVMCTSICTGAGRPTWASVWVCHAVSVGTLGTCLFRCDCRYGV